MTIVLKVLFPPSLAWLRKTNQPTVEYRPVDISNGVQEQLDAVYDLRLRRNIRYEMSHLADCPPPPRIMTHLLSIAEENHVKNCAHCQRISNSRNPTSLFERLVEQRWRRFKGTRSSLAVRAVQVIFLLGLLAVFQLFFQGQTISQLGETNRDLQGARLQIRQLAHQRQEYLKTIADLQLKLQDLSTEASQGGRAQDELKARLLRTQIGLHAVIEESRALRAQYHLVCNTLEAHHISVPSADRQIPQRVGGARSR